MTLTSDLVRAAWRALLVKHSAKVVDKRTSAVMDGAGWLLDRAGIQIRADFKRYTTTLGDTIYAPFTPGEPTDDYSLEGQIAVLAHELVHVEQFHTHGFDFLSGYVIDAARRTIYESAGYRAGETVRRALHLSWSGPDVLAGHLRGYGVSEADISVSRAFHVSSLATMAAGGVLDAEASEVIAFAETYKDGDFAGKWAIGGAP